MFKKGLDFYLFQLNFNFVNIFAELEGDIKRAKEHKNWNLKRKEAKIKELLEVFNFDNEENFELCATIEEIEDSIKTMRDLPLFGST